MQRASKFRIPGFGTQLVMEILIVVLIIMVTASSIAVFSEEIRKKANIVASSSEALGLWRYYASVYYAMNGEWPDSKEDMVGFLASDSPQLTGRYPEAYGSEEFETRSESITFNQGAIDIALSAPHEGKVLTLHPAQPEGDASGPVIWLGGPGPYEGWVLVGPDSTTVPLDELTQNLKYQR